MLPLSQLYHSSAPSYVTVEKAITLNHTYVMPPLNQPVCSKATLDDHLFSFVSCSSKCQLCHITVIIYVLFEDILVSFSFQRMNVYFDHCVYMHGFAML